jgi:hypothetical protein
MKRYTVRSVEAVRYAVLRLVFEDGLTGEIDLTDKIATGPAFVRLRDPEYSKQVAVAEGGHAFGWNLNELGHEIDFCADSARIRIETQPVEDVAEQYRKRSTAAE